MIVEGGGDLLSLKRDGGWLSSNVAEGYIEESIHSNIEISRKLFDIIIVKSSTSSPKNIVHENNGSSTSTTMKYMK